PRPSRCSPSWTRRWWTRNSPGSAHDHVPEAERSMVTAPAQPSPLPRPALDSHTHLDMIDLPVSGVVASARAAGIVRVVTVGTDLESSRWSVRCATEHDVQRWWYREHIKIAKRSGKALMIHDREAHADVLRILEEEGPPDRVVFHCFSGDVAMAKQCAEAGYVMSFAGNVTFANAQPLRDAAAAAPADLILAETDAPFLTPVPNRGKPNEPALTADTLRCLAEVQGLDLAALCDTVTATAQRTFGPW